jgi:hypothetical protein
MVRVVERLSGAVASVASVVSFRKPGAIFAMAAVRIFPFAAPLLYRGGGWRARTGAST